MAEQRACRRCCVAMHRIYHSWYKCWCWKCPQCGFAVTIANTSDDQLSLEHEKGWL